jgi:hypothetical protein
MFNWTTGVFDSAKREEDGFVEVGEDEQ